MINFLNCLQQILRSYRNATMVGLSGAGDTSFEASFELDSGNEFGGFSARDVSAS